MFIVAIFMMSCGAKKNSDIHTTQNSIDWSGVYLSDETNDLPSIQITLGQDNSYQITVLNPEGNQTANDYISGKFQWNKIGSSIQLDKEVPFYGTKDLFVGENYVSFKEKNVTVKKIQVDGNLTEKYWKLQSINNKTVTNKDFMDTEPHFILKSEFNKVRGNDGCNIFNGQFSLDGNSIKFEKMLSTLRACPDSFVSNQLLKILNNNNLTYEVKNDNLTIKSKNDTLKFIAVYL